MNQQQRGYLWGEVYPAFAYGIDRLLDAYGLTPRLFSDDEIHKFFKKSANIHSTERLSVPEVADYITEIQALASGCMIFIASPEEIKRGVAERERDSHYEFMFGENQLAEAA